MKKCSNCFKEKPLNEFYLKRPTGFQSRCKACNNEVCKGYRKRKFQKEFSAYIHGGE